MHFYFFGDIHKLRKGKLIAHATRANDTTLTYFVNLGDSIRTKNSA